MEINTYVPSDIVLLVGGWELTGWNSISVSRNSPTFQQIRGIRGKNTRVRNKDTSAFILIETNQTEIANEVFSKIVEADVEFGTAVLSVSLKDLSGSTVFSTETAYISGYPKESAFTAELGVRNWEIVCEDSKMFVGASVNPNIKLIQEVRNNIPQSMSDGIRQIREQFNL